MPGDKELEAVRGSIRELSGGHSLESMSGDKLWQTREPININKLLEAAETAREVEKAIRAIEAGDYEDVTETAFD